MPGSLLGKWEGSDATHSHKMQFGPASQCSGKSVNPSCPVYLRSKGLVFEYVYHGRIYKNGELKLSGFRRDESEEARLDISDASWKKNGDTITVTFTRKAPVADFTVTETLRISLKQTETYTSCELDASNTAASHTESISSTTSGNAEVIQSTPVALQSFYDSALTTAVSAFSADCGCGSDDAGAEECEALPNVSELMTVAPAAPVSLSPNLQQLPR